MKAIAITASVVLSFFVATNAWAPVSSRLEKDSAADKAGDTGPAVAPPETPSGNVKSYEQGPDRARQITEDLESGTLGQKPPQDCGAIQQAVVKCVDKALAAGGASLAPCDALADQFVACKAAN